MADNITTKKTGKRSEPKTTDEHSSGIGYYMFITAILLIVSMMAFVVFYLFFLKDKNLTEEEFMQMYSYEASIPREIEEIDFYKGPFAGSEIYQAQKAYEEGKYRLAINFYDNALLQFPNRHDLMLYKALAHVGLGEEEIAQPLLMQIIEDPALSLYAPRALWYSALLHLHENEIEPCRQKLYRLLEAPTATKEDKNKANKLLMRMHANFD
ncbi:MAG TPA: hypothetical protein ENJ45_06365 [Phaeodactylibacter sp.]|nr:hypothetical protein [Phaeodactylibacter sp.]